MSGESLKPGDDKILNRPTFLHQGIFVIQGTSVRVMEITNDGIVVQFLDREGHPHILKGIKEEELK